MVLHPDWNTSKGHHTDVEFKHAIARYDWDQTYDVLEFAYLPNGFDELITKIGIPGFFLMAIDRYTPYKYRWAENYSDKVFEFMKEFNFGFGEGAHCVSSSLYDRFVQKWTGFRSDDRTTRCSVLEEDFYNDYPEIISTFPQGYYNITGLIYEGQQGTIESIDTINQATYWFRVSSNSTEIDLKKIINNWLNGYNGTYCANSLVISKIENNVYTDFTPDITSKPPWLFYNDIDTYFTGKKNLINSYFSGIYNTYKVSDKINSNGYSNYICDSRSYIKKLYIEYDVVFEPYYYLDQNNNPTSNIRGYSFFSQIYEDNSNSKVIYTSEKLPNYFLDHCYLQRANNNKWKTGNTYSNLGISPIAKNDNSNNLTINIGGVMSRGKVQYYDQTMRLPTDLAERIMSQAVTYNRPKFVESWNAITKKEYLYPDDEIDFDGDGTLDGRLYPEGTYIKIPEDLTIYMGTTDPNNYFPRKYPITFLGLIDVPGVGSLILDPFFGFRTFSTGISHYFLSYLTKKVKRNGFIMEQVTFERTWYYIPLINFGSFDIYEYEIEYGYFWAISDSITTRKVKNLAYKRAENIDLTPNITPNIGRTQIVDDKYTPNQFTERFKIYEDVEIISSSDFMDAYKNNVDVTDEVYLGLLLEKNNQYYEESKTW